MTTEQDVARHYTHGALETAILDGLRATGKDVNQLQAADLSSVDEFHLGWRAATADLANDLSLSPRMRLLDVGSGIGGPARYFAEEHGVTVTGIDLTDEFVQVANALTRRCNLADRAAFLQASALALPFEDATFDRATMIHVGMNIGDKAQVFREVRRVLKKGGLFAVYDIMNVNGGTIPYPMPWAAMVDTSFVEAPEIYRTLLGKAGFVVESEKNRRDMALTLGREMRENAAKHGLPPLGLHTIMGPAAQPRLVNVMATLAEGTIAPLQMLARAS